ncbi:MAG: cupin domain-containing protein [Polyangiaceae bacterium]
MHDAPPKVHRGSCHCGDLRFEVDGEIEEVLDCNCTICTKKGFLHWIVPPSRFRLLTGAPATYTFGTHTARHTFCARCGLHPFYTPRSHPDHVDVNVRCLDDVDLQSIVVQPFDGRNDWEAARATLDRPRPTPERVDLRERLAEFHEAWSPRVVASLNGQEVKLARFSGPFVWHSHARVDELFLVLEGRFQMELRDRTIDLSEGQLLVVPRGVEHRPVAAEGQCAVLLFEPVGTVKTGD